VELMVQPSAGRASKLFSPFSEPPVYAAAQHIVRRVLSLLRTVATYRSSGQIVIARRTQGISPKHLANERRYFFFFFDLHMVVGHMPLRTLQGEKS